jgi:hypothetical protein
VGELMTISAPMPQLASAIAINKRAASRFIMYAVPLTHPFLNHADHIAPGLITAQVVTQRDLLFSVVFRYIPPAVAKVYIVSFCTLDDRRLSKFIVPADSRKQPSRGLGTRRGRLSIPFRQIRRPSRTDEEGDAGSVVDKLAVNIAEILIWEATHMLLLLGRF